jgi:hypothetical protein
MGVMIQKLKDIDICTMKIVQTSRIGVRSKINGQRKATFTIILFCPGQPEGIFVECELQRLWFYVSRGSITCGAIGI